MKIKYKFVRSYLNLYNEGCLLVFTRTFTQVARLLSTLEANEHLQKRLCSDDVWHSLTSFITHNWLRHFNLQLLQHLKCFCEVCSLNWTQTNQLLVYSFNRNERQLSLTKYFIFYNGSCGDFRAVISYSHNNLGYLWTRSVSLSRITNPLILTVFPEYCVSHTAIGMVTIHSFVSGM